MIKASHPTIKYYQPSTGSEYNQNEPLWRVQQSRRKTKRTAKNTDTEGKVVVISNRFQVLKEQVVSGKIQEITHIPRLPQGGVTIINQEKKTGKALKKKIRLSLYADSQGRSVQQFIEDAGCGGIKAIGFVYPNAGLLEVADCAKHSSDDVIFLMGSTNNTLNNDFQPLYKSLEKKMIDLSRNKTLLISTIPRRFDADIFDPIHNKVNQLNSYIEELTKRLSNVHLIDLDNNNFKYFHFSKQGLHLNRRGKKKLGFIIRDTLATILSGEDSTVAEFIRPVADITDHVAVAIDPLPPQADAEVPHNFPPNTRESSIDTTVTLSQPDKVIVVPGDLTYKEALEQSNGDSAVSVRVHSGLSGCTAGIPPSTLNLLQQVTLPIK